MLPAPGQSSPGAGAHNVRGNIEEDSMRDSQNWAARLAAWGMAVTANLFMAALMVAMVWLPVASPALAASSGYEEDEGDVVLVSEGISLVDSISFISDPSLGGVFLNVDAYGLLGDGYTVHTDLYGVEEIDFPEMVPSFYGGVRAWRQELVTSDAFVNADIWFESEAFEECVRDNLNVWDRPISRRDLAYVERLICDTSVSDLADAEQLYDFTLIHVGPRDDEDHIEGVVLVGSFVWGMMTETTFEVGKFIDGTFMKGLVMADGGFVHGRMMYQQQEDGSVTVEFWEGIDLGDRFIPGWFLAAGFLPGIQINGVMVPGTFRDGIFHPLDGVVERLWNRPWMWERVIDAFHPDVAGGLSGFCGNTGGETSLETFDFSMGSEMGSSSGYPGILVADGSDCGSERDSFGGIPSDVADGLMNPGEPIDPFAGMCSRNENGGGRANPDGSMGVGCGLAAMIDEKYSRLCEQNDACGDQTDDSVGDLGLSEREWLAHLQRLRNLECADDECGESGIDYLVFGAPGNMEMGEPYGFGDEYCGTPWGGAGLPPMPQPMGPSPSFIDRILPLISGLDGVHGVDSGAVQAGRPTFWGCTGAAVALGILVVATGGTVGVGLAVVALGATIGAYLDDLPEAQYRDQMEQGAEELGVDDDDLARNFTPEQLEELLADEDLKEHGGSYSPDGEHGMTILPESERNSDDDDD